MDLNWIDTPASSMISRIAWDAETGETHVEFARGAHWAYFSSEIDFNAFRDADSTGKHFLAEIRDLGGRRVDG